MSICSAFHAYLMPKHGNSILSLNVLINESIFLRAREENCLTMDKSFMIRKDLSIE